MDYKLFQSIVVSTGFGVLLLLVLLVIVLVHLFFIRNKNFTDKIISVSFFLANLLVLIASSFLFALEVGSQVLPIFLGAFIPMFIKSKAVKYASNSQRNPERLFVIQYTANLTFLLVFYFVVQTMDVNQTRWLIEYIITGVLGTLFFNLSVRYFRQKLINMTNLIISNY